MNTFALLAFVLFGLSEPAEAQTPATDFWGEAVDGIQLHLAISTTASRPNAPLPTVVELPRLEVQIRNQGTDTITFGLDSDLWNVEIDGIWYGPGPRAGGAPACVEVLPGAQRTFSVVGTDNLAELNPGGAGWPSSKLTLMPGKHSIRVRTTHASRCVPFRGPLLQGIVAVSNVITIDVADVPAVIQRQALIDAVLRSGGAAGEAVRTLVEKYPDAAFGAILSATRATTDEFTRGDLVSLLTDVQGEDVTDFLRSELASGTDSPSRSAAAWVLFQRGDRLSIPAAFAAWSDIQPMLPLAASQYGVGFAVGRLISILAESGDASAIDTLRRDFLQEPIDVRLATLRAFLPRPTGGSIATGGGIPLNGELVELPGGEAGAAIDRLLIAALDDKEQRTGLSGTFNGFSYENPRVCDIAAMVFFQRWPQKYPFHWSTDVSERDSQIDAIRITWRSNNGFSR